MDLPFRGRRSADNYKCIYRLREFTGSEEVQPAVGIWAENGSESRPGTRRNGRDSIGPIDTSVSLTLYFCHVHVSFCGVAEFRSPLGVRLYWGCVFDIWRWEWYVHVSWRVNAATLPCIVHPEHPLGDRASWCNAPILPRGHHAPPSRALRPFTETWSDRKDFTGGSCNND